MGKQDPVSAARALRKQLMSRMSSKGKKQAERIAASKEAGTYKGNNSKPRNNPANYGASPRETPVSDLSRQELLLIIRNQARLLQGFVRILSGDHDDQLDYRHSAVWDRSFTGKARRDF